MEIIPNGRSENLGTLNDKFCEFIGTVQALEANNNALKEELFSCEERLKSKQRRLAEKAINDLYSEYCRISFNNSKLKYKIRSNEHELCLTNKILKCNRDIAETFSKKIQLMEEKILHSIERLQLLDNKLNATRIEVRKLKGDVAEKFKTFCMKLTLWQNTCLEKEKVQHSIELLKNRVEIESVLNTEETNRYSDRKQKMTVNCERYVETNLESIKLQVKNEYAQLAVDQKKEMQMAIEAHLKQFETNLHDDQLNFGLSTQTATSDTPSAEYLNKELTELNDKIKYLISQNTCKKKILKEEETKYIEENKIRHVRKLKNYQKLEELKNEYDELRTETEKLAANLKYSTQEELNIYKTLLKSVPDKTKDDSHHASVHITKPSSNISAVGQGCIIIKSVDTRREFIEIENLGRHRICLNGWILEREVDNIILKFYFPSNCFIEPSGKLKIYAANVRNTEEQSLVAGFNSWLTGFRTKTVLRNSDGTEKAILLQEDNKSDSDVKFNDI